MKKRLILILSFIMMMLFVLPFGNVNVKAAGNKVNYYVEDVEIIDEEKAIYIAGYKIVVDSYKTDIIDDEDFGGFGIVEGEVKFKYKSYTKPTLTLSNFSYDFDKAQELGVEIPSTFIRSNIDIIVEIRNTCSFGHNTLAQSGIVVTNGASLTIDSFSLSQELNITVQDCPIYVEGDIIIRRASMNLTSVGQYPGIIAGGKAEWNETSKKFDYLSLNNKQVDETKLTENSSFLFEEANTFGTIINTNVGLETIVASEDIIFNNQTNATPSYYSLVFNTASFKSRMKAGRNIEINGNNTIGTFEKIVAKGDITVENNATLNCHTNSKTINAEGTFTVSYATVDATLECSDHDHCESYSIECIAAKDIVIKNNSLVKAECAGKAIAATDSIFIEDSEVYTSGNCQSGDDSGAWSMVLIGASKIDIINSKVEADAINYCWGTYGDAVAIKADELIITDNSYVNAKVETNYTLVSFYSLNAITTDELTISDNSVVYAHSNKKAAIKCNDVINIESSKIFASTGGEDDNCAIDALGFKGDCTVLSGSDANNVNPGLNPDTFYAEVFCANRIYLKPIENGSIIVSPNVIRPSGEAHRGDLVKFIILPDEGYMLDTINVYNKNDNTEIITVTDNSFIMPGFDVEMEVTFKKLVDVILQYEDTSENVFIESTKVPTPKTVEGKVFMGWYIDEECSTLYDFSTPLTNGTKLYAKYEAIPEGVGNIAEAIEAAKTELKGLIDDKADNKEIERKIAELRVLISSIKNQVNNQNDILKEEVNNIINEATNSITNAYQEAISNSEEQLKQLINDKASSSEVNNKVEELKTLIDSVKDYANTQDTNIKVEINQTINTATTTITNAYQEAIKNAKEELQKLIDSKADSETVFNAITELQNSITSLEEIKNNYIEADNNLKTELEAIIEQAKLEAIESAKGYIPYIGTNGNWWIGNKDTGVDASGKIGVGIEKIEKTETKKNVDTYTITLTDGSIHSFTVTNGNTTTYIVPIIISVISLFANVALIVFLVLKKKKETK